MDMIALVATGAVVAITAVLSYVGGRWLSAAAAPLGFVDEPSSRGMHRHPIPRAGGVAVGPALAVGTALLAVPGWRVDAGVAAVAAGAVWAVGVADDRWRMPARWRFAVQLAAVSVVAMILPVALPGPAWVWQVLAVVGWVWSINAHNFMDGIDAIAAVQAVTVFAGMALLTALHGSGAVPWLVVAAAYAGFAVLNWPPARLFLGDGGSTLLGYLVGLGTASAVLQASTTAYGWFILSAVFFTDATWTLVVRVATGQRWYRPHRLHAYQKLALRWGSHARVSAAVALVNLVWLLPLALLAAASPHWGPMVCVLAYVPLFAVAWYCRAGWPEAQT